MVATVTATVRESFACLNGGDYLRALSFVSEDRLRAAMRENPVPVEALRALLEAPPEPLPPAERGTVLAVTDVSVLADGRVGAFVASARPGRGPDTAYTVFVREGGRWLVDESIEFLDPGDAGAAATPTD